jgi:hypothetical protein
VPFKPQRAPISHPIGCIRPVTLNADWLEAPFEQHVALLRDVEIDDELSGGLSQQVSLVECAVLIVLPSNCQCMPSTRIAGHHHLEIVTDGDAIYEIV